MLIYYLFLVSLSILYRIHMLFRSHENVTSAYLNRSLSRFLACQVPCTLVESRFQAEIVEEKYVN